MARVGDERGAYRVWVGRYERKRGLLEDLCVNVKIILKLILMRTRELCSIICRNAWLGDKLLVPQEGLCSIHLVCLVGYKSL